jgi:two-component system LytT family response regulator
MINTVLIDDESHSLESLETDLKKHCPEIHILAKCGSAKEGILAIKGTQPQLVFLDIQMPWVNGFEMLEMLDQINFSIIFTTAFDQFAARAFRLSAVDYLLKPIDTHDLKTAVDKVIEKIRHASDKGNINNLLQNFKLPALDQKIALPNRDGYEFALVNSILYCLAEGAYTRVILTDNRKLLISKPLGDIEEMLPADMFIRIHHSTVVNINAVTHYVRTDGGYVIMNNNEKLMVSKARKEKLMQRLGLKA